MDDNCNSQIDKNTDISKWDLFLTECCSHRCKNLNEAINDLNIKSIDHILNLMNHETNVNPMRNFVPYSDDINELYNLYVDYFNKYKHEILKSHGYCKFDDKLLYIFKYEKIIQELHKVIQYANDNNVFQDWDATSRTKLDIS